MGAKLCSIYTTNTAIARLTLVDTQQTIEVEVEAEAEAEAEVEVEVKVEVKRFLMLHAKLNQYWSLR